MALFYLFQVTFFSFSIIYKFYLTVLLNAQFQIVSWWYGVVIYVEIFIYDL